MSKLLRGKRLNTLNPKENFTKVPNELLFAKGLSAVDKLILIHLHYYPANWTLAYTRLAKELGIDKSNLIDRWKHLTGERYIIEDATSYTINYTLLSGGATPPNENQGLGDPTKQGSATPPYSGGVNQPSKVGLPLLDGGATPAIEEDTKEQDLKNKTKEEDCKTIEVENLKPIPTETGIPTNMFNEIPSDMNIDMMPHLLKIANEIIDGNQLTVFNELTRERKLEILDKLQLEYDDELLLIKFLQEKEEFQPEEKKDKQVVQPEENFQPNPIIDPDLLYQIDQQINWDKF